jgi:Fe-Mn family superoxide dismutase
MGGRNFKPAARPLSSGAQTVARDLLPRLVGGERAMKFELQPLPWGKDALEPFLGRETLALHHGEHERGYLKKLEGLLEGKPEADQSLEEIVQRSEGAVFENAAQVWNHQFYWRSMKPNGGGEPGGPIAEAIERSFGGLSSFRTAFIDAGVERFGSGWLWLVRDGERLRLESTANADTPLREGEHALLTADLWEHAYYLDFRNERNTYLTVFLDFLVNWAFAASNWRRGDR